MGYTRSITDARKKVKGNGGHFRFNIHTMSPDSVFPVLLEKATVKMTPKPKKDLTKVSNYRPIWLLSCIGMLFKKCVADRLLNYLELNNLFTPNQSGSAT